jgi:hypothetical protein
LNCKRDGLGSLLDQNVLPRAPKWTRMRAHDMAAVSAGAQMWGQAGATVVTGRCHGGDRPTHGTHKKKNQAHTRRQEGPEATCKGKGKVLAALHQNPPKGHHHVCTTGSLTKPTSALRIVRTGREKQGGPAGEKTASAASSVIHPRLRPAAACATRLSAAPDEGGGSQVASLRNSSVRMQHVRGSCRTCTRTGSRWSSQVAEKEKARAQQ